MARNRQNFPTLIAAWIVSTAAVTPAYAESSDSAIPLSQTVPTGELRVLGGLGGAIEMSLSLFEHRLRFDAAARGIPSDMLTEDAVSARVLGSPENGFWLRAGYMVQRYQYDNCSQYGGTVSDTPTSIDASLAYRKRWPGNSFIALEGGVERVWRDRLRCMDSGLGDGSGNRLSVAGQWTFARHVGLYGRVGLRTGPHVNEIGFLPELWLGLAVEI